MARKKNSSAEVTGPRIRAAAQELFARHGYAAVSMRQIAAEVGVQAGALYLYTPDKQSLLFDMMRDHLAELLDTHAALPECADPMAALEQFTRFHIRFHNARSDSVFIAYMELRNLERANFTRIEAMRRSYEARLQEVLERGRAAGVFDVPDTKLAAFALIAMLTGVNTWFRETGRLSLSHVEDIYWDMVRKSVGG
ncbi:TetR/AcrR family transcriptional regulator [Roseinatronobacter alkalisoli]|uniref:TetR/AcrR family transcriptional regulator n=1 Tax=Roseinatronobacter alkalisoli TaxID=3028235 RepID=A0ABT5TBG9_9RHOB|nr:TetR/AcrR family transcriptional regulator [Roseinatronobacter sp. HJB301]MDD7972465.1 TetR/AcrR family transcriptional regulator [Roseinatronobacter sp. HJB301]